MDWKDAQQRRQTQRRIARLIAVFGALIAALAVWFAITKVEQLHHGLVATGTVVDVASSADRNGRVYHPRIEFRERTGEMVVFTDWEADGYSRGEVVKVIYDPRRPSEASVHSPFNDWKAPVGLSIFAIILLWPSIHRLRSPR